MTWAKMANHDCRCKISFSPAAPHPPSFFSGSAASQARDCTDNGAFGTTSSIYAAHCLVICRNCCEYAQKATKALCTALPCEKMLQIRGTGSKEHVFSVS
jgi:hypothetical protein